MAQRKRAGCFTATSNEGGLGNMENSDSDISEGFRSESRYLSSMRQETALYTDVREQAIKIVDPIYI